MKKVTPYLLAALVLAVLVGGFIGIHQTNVTWDEAVGDLFFGQRYVSFFTSFDPRYLDFRGDPYPPGFQPDLRASFLRLRPWEHYPVASTLAMATSRILTAAQLLDPFDGYHAFNVILAAAFLIVFYRFVDRGDGAVAAMTAALLLFAAPRIVADTLGNVKDYAEMVFFSAALIALWRAIERERLPLFLASGALAGLALGTKANALFLAPIAIIYVLTVGRWQLADRPLPTANRQLSTLLVWLAVMIAVFFASWPYLWSHPVDALMKNARYVFFRGTDVHLTNSANPFAMVLFTTPPTFLLAFALGLFPLARRVRAREPFALLLACWIGVVTARLAVPGAVNFDGVRHFLELFPPMAAVGGIGVAALGRWRKLASAAAIAPVVIALAVVHPFEATYWNVFIGGLGGAIAHHQPQAGDYWAASYRIGLRWLNENAPRDTLLAVPIAEHTVRMVAPYRLRPDIRLVHLTNPWSARVDARTLAALRAVSAQRPVYVMSVFREDWANELVLDMLNGLPQLQVWQVDGAPVLAICRLTPAPPPGRRP